MANYKSIVKKIAIQPNIKTKQKEYLDLGTLAIVDQGKELIGGYSNDLGKTVECKLPVIVFGDHTRAVKYVSFPFGAGADGIKILEPKDGIVPKYLYYGTQYLVAKMPNHGYARHYQFLEKMDLPVPPLPEQQRIVARIEELFSQLDSGVETLRKTKQQLAVYRQAIYSSVFNEFKSFARITDYFDISSGLTKNSARAELPLKMPYLRVANVYYNQLDLNEIKYIGVKAEEVEKTLLKADDLLFVEGNGSKDQIGRVAIWDGSVENCLHQNHIIKGRAIGNMLPRFALYYLISAYGRKQIISVASSTSGLYTLSANKVRSLNVPVCTIEQQKQCIADIEGRLSNCDSIEQTVDAALQQAEALRQSILKQAFEGGL